ncbi:MAG: ABC transporter permease subunit, partial [Pseudomonadota bacterium]
CFRKRSKNRPPGGSLSHATKYSNATSVQWQSMRLIVLPQALKISIPGIVNTFIGLFKDTTLVIIIGLLDILGMGRASLADSKWAGLSNEVYISIAVFFFLFCFAMSRYSLYLESKLETGHRT